MVLKWYWNRDKYYVPSWERTLVGNLHTILYCAFIHSTNTENLLDSKLNHQTHGDTGAGFVFMEHLKKQGEVC